MLPEARWGGASSGGRAEAAKARGRSRRTAAPLTPDETRAMFAATEGAKNRTPTEIEYTTRDHKKNLYCFAIHTLVVTWS